MSVANAINTIQDAQTAGAEIDVCIVYFILAGVSAPAADAIDIADDPAWADRDTEFDAITVDAAFEQAKVARNAAERMDEPDDRAIDNMAVAMAAAQVAPALSRSYSDDFDDLSFLPHDSVSAMDE